LIDLSKDKILSKTEIAVARILEELSIVAFLDPAQFYDKRGKLLPITKMPEEARRALLGIEHDKHSGKITKLRFLGKMEAITLAMHYLQMLTERVEVSRPEDGAIPIEIARRIIEEGERAAAVIDGAPAKENVSFPERPTGPIDV
jgi:terminase small subunit-like protein